MIDENRLNELMKDVKRNFPDMDNYLNFVICTDYIYRDEMGLEIDEDIRKEIQEKFEKSKEPNNIKIQECL